MTGEPHELLMFDWLIRPHMPSRISQVELLRQNIQKTPLQQ